MRARRTNTGAYLSEEVVLTQELIHEFLARMGSTGSAKGTLDTDRGQLNLLCKLLPEDKCIRPGSINAWRDELFEQGYAGRTVGNAVSVANSFLTWLGRRELQGGLFQSHEEDIQPELTCNEYLRLLSTARNLGKELVYLLIKVFATTSISLQNLAMLTVEAVQENTVHIPACVKGIPAA